MLAFILGTVHLICRRGGPGKNIGGGGGSLDFLRYIGGGAIRILSDEEGGHINFWYSLQTYKMDFIISNRIYVKSRLQHKCKYNNININLNSYNRRLFISSFLPVIIYTRMVSKQ